MLELTNIKDKTINLGTIRGCMLNFQPGETKQLDIETQEKFQSRIETYVSGGFLSVRKVPSRSIDSPVVEASDETKQRRGRPRRISE